MLDRQMLRNDLAGVATRLATRGYELDTEKYEKLEADRKTIQTRAQELQASSNRKSKMIGQLRGAGHGADDEEIGDLLREMQSISEQKRDAEKRDDEIRDELDQFLDVIPNVPHADVPVGKSEADNKEVRKVGETKSSKEFGFEAKDHVTLGEGLGGLDFETAAKISGARFSLLKGPLARLHRALAQFMLDTHTEQHGYTEVYVPYLVNAESMRGTGQLPKFKVDLFGTLDHGSVQITDTKLLDEIRAQANSGNELEILTGLDKYVEARRGLYLIPTAEVPITNMVRDSITPLEQLPLKYVAHTPCFRSEAGSYGRDTRGTRNKSASNFGNCPVPRMDSAFTR